MRRIWVGAAASMTAWGLVQTIRERLPGAFVVAADSGPRELAAASAVADAFVRVPVAADPAFADALVAGLAEHRIDVYAPIHDAELVAGARLRDRGELPTGVRCTAPPASVAALCADKLAVSGVLAEAGVAVPRTEPGDAAWTGPCVVKPRRGVGSRGVRLVDAAQRSPEERTAGFVAQEPCLGPEVTIDAFLARDGRSFAAACRERVEVRAGITTKARVFADDELAELARAVAAATGLHGTYCVQAMRAADGGGWCVTDVNPRPGGATRMSVVCGVDVHSAMLADACGEPADAHLAPLTVERWVTRGYVECLTTP